MSPPRCLAVFGALALLLVCAQAQYCSRTFAIQEEGDANYGNSEEPGGTYTWVNNLYAGNANITTADTIGTSTGVCTASAYDEESGENVAYCTVSLNIDERGSIVASGDFRDNGDEFTLAVTGGTGKYKGASGVIKGVSVEIGLHWRYNIVLQKTPSC